MRWIYRVVALATALWAAPASAQSLSPLEIDTVLSSVDSHHPAVQAGRARVDEARAALREASGGFDTSLEGLGEVTPQGPAGANGRLEAGVRQPMRWWGAQVIVGWRLGLGEFPVYKGEYKTVAPQGEVFAGVDVPLLRDREVDKRRLAEAKAALGVKIAEQELRKEQLKVALKAAQTYWKWVATGRKLAVERRLLEIAQQRDAAIRARVDAGELPEIDHIENQRAIAQRQARIASAQGELGEAAWALSLFWRDAQGAPQVAGEGALPARGGQAGQAGEIALEEALSARPELEAIALKRRALELERAWTQAQQLPKLDLSAKASKGLVPEIDYLDEVSVGVKLQYFLGQEVARGQEEGLDARLVALEAERRAARDGVQAELGAAWVGVEASRARVELGARELEIARQVEQAERDRLALGDSTLLLVNLREQATADAEKALIDAEAAYEAALAAYRLAAGRLR